MATKPLTKKHSVLWTIREIASRKIQELTQKAKKSQESGSHEKKYRVTPSMEGKKE